jgi:hypothetical protein
LVFSETIYHGGKPVLAAGRPAPSSAAFCAIPTNSSRPAEKISRAAIGAADIPLRMNPNVAG